MPEPLKCEGALNCAVEPSMALWWGDQPHWVPLCSECAQNALERARRALVTAVIVPIATAQAKEDKGD